MLLRPGTLNDIPHIMQLVARVVPLMIASGNLQWDSTYPNEEVFKNDISLKQLWIVEVDAHIAGITAITTNQEAEYALVGWDITEEAIVTHRLAVDPFYRGLGIASALLQKAEEEAVRLGIKILRVDTNTGNQVTQKLFPKMGYTYAREIGLAFRPGLRFYCYEKRLV